MFPLLMPLALAGLQPRPSTGVLEMAAGDQTLSLGSDQTTVEAWIQGDLATVRLEQVFTNPLEEAVGGAYLFPLPENAAVYSMRFTVGEEIIEGTIRERAAAEEAFAEAKKSGQTAALLSQHRPNVFTWDLANIAPGVVVKVELEYAHTVPRRDGAYGFRFPLSVGERYVPADRSAKPGEPEPLKLGEWNLGSGDAAPAAALSPDSLDLTVHLSAGVPVQWLHVDSHPSTMLDDGDRWRTIRLSEDVPVKNTDFEMRYRLSGEDVSVGATVFADGDRRVASLLIEPPAQRPKVVVPREMVFLLDCSGSMGGEPMEASKRFMTTALKNLQPVDTFRIIRFSEGVSGLTPEPLPATPANISRALAYIHTLNGTGGTEMSAGIRAAFAQPEEAGRMRIVTFLTDGRIGNDADIIRLVESSRGQSRLFAFGLGQSINTWLLENLARAGRGSLRTIADGEGVEAAADQLAERLAAPVLTDITIDWGEAPVVAPTPAQLPDLFHGDSLRVLTSLGAAGRWPVPLHGTLGGKPATLPFTLTVPQTAPEASALPVVWARSLIQDRMTDYMSPATDEAGRTALKSEITALGLDYSLLTQWTSFVAISNQPIAQNPPPSHSAAVAAGAPEPAEWAALLLLVLLATTVLYRR